MSHALYFLLAFMGSNITTNMKRQVSVTGPNVCGKRCPFPTMAIFFLVTRIEVTVLDTKVCSACLETVCCIRDIVSSQLLVARCGEHLSFFPLIVNDVREGKASKKALWLSGLQGREMHFIFLLRWQAGSWGHEEGASPSCCAQALRRGDIRAAWSRWCRAHPFWRRHKLSDDGPYILKPSVLT